MIDDTLKSDDALWLSALWSNDHFRVTLVKKGSARQVTGRGDTFDAAVADLCGKIGAPMVTLPGLD